jgi:hypothetical protein
MLKWPKWNMTGRWSGHYTYEDSPTSPEFFPATPFLLLAKQGWFGCFSGTVTDAPLQTNQEVAYISGWIGMKEAYFKKQYPRLFFFGENRNISFRESLALEGLTLDEDIPSSPIHYTGIYDETNDSISGTWIIHPEDLQFKCSGQLMGMQVEELRGSWTARRETTFL